MSLRKLKLSIYEVVMPREEEEVKFVNQIDSRVSYLESLNAGNVKA
jgi:hypothetical protein